MHLLTYLLPSVKRARHGEVTIVLLAVAAALSTAVCKARCLGAGGLLLAEVAGSLSAHEVVAGHDSSTSAQWAWRSQRACGLNSVYFMLHYCGAVVDYDELARHLLGKSPASLLDLKQAAAEHGITLHLAKATPASIQDCQMPAIAHLDVVGVSGEAGGHYVVITRAVGHGVRYIDGTTLETKEANWAEFQKDWSGFIAHLDPAIPTSAWQSEYGLSILSFLGGAFLAMLFQRSAPHKLCRRRLPSLEVQS